MAMKIALVGSSGGHLMHLLLLREWWVHHDRFWVTFDKVDAVSNLRGERLYGCYYPTNRNLLNLLKNTALAFKILFQERPDVIVSSGAAVAVPFFLLARLFGARTVYLEVYDRINSPTITGRIVYHFTDKFFVQWPEQLAFYPKATLVGELI